MTDTDDEQRGPTSLRVSRTSLHSGVSTQPVSYHVRAWTPIAAGSQWAVDDYEVVTSDVVAVIRWAEALPDVSNFELYVTTGNATDLHLHGNPPPDAETVHTVELHDNRD
ncbi:MAG: hypothetical protein ACTJGQ_02380 [Agrococcus casei]|uniref:hypothetical protein n=1 Tax=Agrococcus casei TaxID=343512 RepID=UPI003F8E7DF8